MGTCSSNGEEQICNQNSLNLSSNEIQLIEKSWEPIVDSGLEIHGMNMMVRIFTKYPELKHLWSFARNLETESQIRSSPMVIAHAQKLFNTIDTAISLLGDLNTLVPILIQLGCIHYKYGVMDYHFEVVIGKMLIETLENGLREKFTPKVMQSWIKLFGIVAFYMKLGLCKMEPVK